MSSPIGNRSPSPIPSTSSQTPAVRETVIRRTDATIRTLLETTALVADLLDLSLKKGLPRSLAKCFRHYEQGTFILKTTSDQIKGIANATVRSATEIASAIAQCNISLQNKIETNTSFSPEEISKIKALLTSSQQKEDQPSTSREAVAALSQARARRPQLESEHHLPIKKRKLQWGHLASIETPQAGTSQTSELCSLRVLTAFLENLESNRPLAGPRKPFLCPQGHRQGLCAECSPLRIALSNALNPSLSQSTWQLYTLLKYTSPQKLASAIHKNSSILSRLLSGLYLQNHHLCIVIEESNIPDSIFHANTNRDPSLNPFYKVIDTLTSTHKEHDLLKTVLEIWESRSLQYLPTHTLIWNDKEGSAENCSDLILANKVPLMDRFYQRKKSLSQYKDTFIKTVMTSNFSRFIAKVTLDTLMIMQKSDAHKGLFFTDTPQGKLPDTRLAEKIFALVLLSHEKSFLFAPPCKATSVYSPQQMAFNEELRPRWCQALENFAHMRNILLPGSHAAKKTSR